MANNTSQFAFIFRISQLRKYIIATKFYQLSFLSLMLICVFLELIPKPTILQGITPSFLVVGIIAFVFALPKINICMEMLVIGFVIDIIYGLHMGVSSLSLLITYGLFSLVLTKLSNIGQVIRMIAICIFVVIQRLLLVWLLALLSQSAIQLYLNVTGVVSTIITTIMVEMLLFHIFNRSKTHAQQRSVPR